MNIFSPHVQTVLDILQNEVDGDVAGAFSKMSGLYSQTWMYKNKEGDIFPRIEKPTKLDLQSVYHIPGREYHIYNITESLETVMVECIEIYKGVETGKVCMTPLVLIVEFDGDKISKGRHYCDPALSYLELDKKIIVEALSNKKTIVVIR